MYKLIESSDKFKEFLISNNYIEKSSISSNSDCIDPNDNYLTIFKDILVFKCNFLRCHRRWSARNNIFSFIQCSNLKFNKKN